jgi:hypothetical protein
MLPPSNSLLIVIVMRPDDRLLRRVVRAMKLLPILALVLAAGVAEAVPVEGRYTASWAGLPAGEIHLRIDDDGTRYRSMMQIRTEGLPRFFTRFNSVAVSEGELVRDGSVRPVQYEAVYDLRKRKDKRASLRFVSRNGALVAERGPEDTSKKPPPPEAHRRNVVDPLSALVAVRQQLTNGTVRAGERFAVPVFDGSRRFDAVGTVRRLPGILRVDLMLMPVAGFKDEKPDEDEDPEDSPRPVTIDFSDDQLLKPLRLEVSIAWFAAVIRLADPVPQASSR